MTPSSGFSPLHWDYPAKPQGEMNNLVPAEYFFGLARALGGHYPLGDNGLCHPGIHFDIGSASVARTKDVFAIADGEIIAYRLDAQPSVTRYPDKLAVFDSSFVLIRHKLQMPPVPTPVPAQRVAPPASGSAPQPGRPAGADARGPAAPPNQANNAVPSESAVPAPAETPPSITLYSLYMHLASWQTYERDHTLVRPPYIDTIYKVKSNLADSLCGMRLITKPKGAEIGIVPKGCKIVLGDRINSHYSKVVEIIPASAVPAWARGMEACIYHAELAAGGLVSDKANDTAKTSAPVKALYVYKNKTKDARGIISNLPAGAQLVLGERSDTDRDLYKIINVANLQNYPELPKNNGKIEGWVDITKLEAKPNVSSAGVKLIADKPYPVKAGQYIGQFGLYQNHNQNIPQQQIHLELFSTEDLKAFVEKCRGKADRLDKKHENLVKIPKGTLLAPQPQSTVLSSQNPPRSEGGTPIQTDLYFSKSSLAELKSSDIIKVIVAANSRENTPAKTINWYRLKNVAATEAGITMDGWVSDESFKMVNPWSFPGFEFIEDDAQPVDLLAYQLSVTNKIRGAEAEKHQDKIERGAHSKLVTTLLSMLGKNKIKDLNVGNILTAQLFGDGLKSFWYSQQTGSLVLKTKTQWMKDLTPYKALEPVLKTSEEIANPTWEKELERMQKLAFWEDVSGVTGGADGKIWFLNPIIMVSNHKQKEALRCRSCGANISLTAEFFTKIAASASAAVKQDFPKFANELFEKYGINTCKQVNHILAQGYHETGGFKKFIENLNYSRATFTATKLYNLSPTIINQGFTRKGLNLTRDQKLDYIDEHLLGNAAAYAEHCYGNNDYPGRDYRGRGLLHLTHFTNYRKFDAASDSAILDNPQLVNENLYTAIESGAWFWSEHGIGAIADNQNNVRAVTSPINPALDQVALRIQYFNTIKLEFKNYYGGCNV
ncbi:MAG TPA: hypothetical protein VN030_01400 [Cellvibrio sp.]|nr:hypothetical protein [Cellvibrio sp.]